MVTLLRFAIAALLVGLGPTLAGSAAAAQPAPARSPAEMPIEQADRFELIVNRKTARLLGLTVPPSILLQAEHMVD